MAGISYSPYDRDLMIRMTMAESRGQPFEGQLGVAHVIANRARMGRYGQGIAGVITRPRQFEPWATRRQELMGYTPQTSGWADAERAVDGALTGQLPDPTGGATHFANAAVVRQRGDAAGRPGGWLSKMANQRQIGAHTFGNADGLPGSGGANAPKFAQMQGPMPQGMPQQGEAAPVQVAQQQQQQPQQNGPSILNPERNSIVGMLASPEGITAEGLKGLASSGKVSGALSGLAKLAGEGQQKQQAPQIIPVQAEVNTPDLALLANLKRKRGFFNGLA